MALREQKQEIRRLIAAFENEAAKNHAFQLSAFFVTQNGPSSTRLFSHPNHTIMLWQYYGGLEPERGPDKFINNLQDSDMKWGVRGAELTSFAVLEGPSCDQFVRLAMRAGSLFDKDEVLTITGAINKVAQWAKIQSSGAKPVVITNNNPLAVWLNYLLYDLSRVHPGREKAEKIEPDPYSLSLLALERLSADLTMETADRSVRRVDDIRYKVAVSFPGEKRDFVSQVVDFLRPTLGPDAIFYDFDYQAQLARPNLDTLLQDIYRNRSELLVVFLCAEYNQKQWCGLEWRAVRDIIKGKVYDRVMLVRFDDAAVEGVFSIDGYIDARIHSPQRIAEFIAERWAAVTNPKA